jgi:TRAP-type C4-dicarboxylate transport system permease small subunit
MKGEELMRQRTREVIDLVACLIFLIFFGLIAAYWMR